MNGLLKAELNSQQSLISFGMSFYTSSLSNTAENNHWINISPLVRYR